MNPIETVKAFDAWLLELVRRMGVARVRLGGLESYAEWSVVKRQLRLLCGFGTRTTGSYLSDPLYTCVKFCSYFPTCHVLA
jgi:hypothetical protein